MNRWIYSFLLLPFLAAADLTPFALITMPKSGSHMMIKALHLITGSPAIWHTHFPSFWCIPPEHGFLYTHFCLDPQLECNYRALPELRKVISIRDLRDVAVSIVSQIKRSPWPGMDSDERAVFLGAPFDEQLLFVIDYEYDVIEVAAKAPNSSQASLIRVAEQAALYAADPNNLVCRYEDLVGEMGGGSLERQLHELRRMAQFIGAELSEEQVFEIAESLYGNEFDPFGKQGFEHFHSTFSKGKIGAWRRAFKEEHKIAFKKKLGKALIELGYEDDDDW
jgi:hypothetical protein